MESDLLPVLDKDKTELVMVRWWYGIGSDGGGGGEDRP